MKKLAYPLWLRLCELIGMVIIPLLIVIIEIMQTKSTGYQVTISILLLAWVSYVIMKKFFVDKYILKLQKQSATLELNYNTGVGDKIKTKAMWAQNNLIISSLEALGLVLLALVVIFVIKGLTDGLLKFQGAFLLICLNFLIILIVKFMWLLFHLKEVENVESKSS